MSAAVHGILPSPSELEESPWFFGELVDAVRNAPTYHVIVEVLLIALVLRLWFFNSYKIEQQEELTEEEQDQLIREWTPQPLVPTLTPQGTPDQAQVAKFAAMLNHDVISGSVGRMLEVNGRKCLDLVSFNFLGLIGDSRIEEACVTSLGKYGLGSCGPRGFYGTIDVHLDLERRLAQFMHVEEAILYSYGFSTMASAIAAYSKKGDVIFADEAVNFSIQQGMKASRSKVRFFKHNDMVDLERLLKEQLQDDIRNPSKAKVTRRFIIAEGLYFNRGTLCPVEKLIDLKYTYKARILLDESYSIGVIGKTGRGVTEHFGCDVTDIDLICGSLENSIGTIGGFCCGSEFVVDHQRISASGYVFSASLPPLLATAAICALDIIEQDAKNDKCRLEALRMNSRALHSQLSQLTSVHVISCAESPMQHVTIDDPSKSYEQCEQVLRQVSARCALQGFAVSPARYIPHFETFTPRPTLRIAVKYDTLEEEISQFVHTFHHSLLEAL